MLVVSSLVPVKILRIIQRNQVLPRIDCPKNTSLKVQIMFASYQYRSLDEIKGQSSSHVELNQAGHLLSVGKLDFSYQGRGNHTHLGNEARKICAYLVKARLDILKSRDGTFIVYQIRHSHERQNLEMCHPLLSKEISP